MPPRPCAVKHPEPVPDKCRLCELFLYDHRYNLLWGGSGIVTVSGVRLDRKASPLLRPCMYLGEETSERKLCNTCKGKVALKVFACSHPAHGTTTLQDCRRCPDRRTAPVRNLLYHVMPVRGNGVWQRNIDHLKKRWHVFTGQKVIAVVRDGRCDPPEAVQQYLDQPEVSWIIKKNHSGIGEVWTWRDLWASLDGSPGLTFYGHAKGVTRPAGDLCGVQRWTDIMYQASLDYMPLVEELLTKFMIAGSFRQSAAVPWHYSGTFYWVRTDEGIAKHGAIHQGWCGTEFWPGIVFLPEQGGTIFRDSRRSSIHMYSTRHAQYVEQEFHRWQKLNAQYRSALDVAP